MKLAAFFVFFGFIGFGLVYFVLTPDPEGGPVDFPVTRAQVVEGAGDFADAAAATLPELDEPPDEGPVYSVQPLANVDMLTASMTLESIQTSGFSGFLIAGSDQEGYDVWRPGLEFDEALRLELELMDSSIIPRYDWISVGFYVLESDNLR